MFRKTLTTGLALAVLATTTIAVTQPASARMHAKRMRMAKRMRLVPSQQKASFQPIRAGGPMMLVDIPPVAAGGGALGLGIAPSTGLFKGVPVIGGLGL